MGLFSSKSTKDNEFDEKIKIYIGGVFPSATFNDKLHEHGLPFNTSYKDIREILKSEHRNGKLTADDVEKRMDEIMELDIYALKSDILKKGYDTSVFKTQDDLNEFLGPEYAKEHIPRSKKNKMEYYINKYNINIENAYQFECTIEEERSSTFTNSSQRDVENAYVIVSDDNLAIIKESLFLKSDMGMRKIYYENIAGIDYDTTGTLGLSSSLFIHLKSSEHVQLKDISDDDVNEVHIRFENYINKKNKPIVQNNINQNGSDADELLKYAELYEKGLLTKEEFETKKQQILNNEAIPTKAENLNENDSQLKPKFCSNCGTAVYNDSKFCSNCGNKL